MPILPQQHAIIMGEAVRTPSQVRINDITKKPDSNNPKFIEQWLKEKSEIEIKPVTDKWLDIDKKDDKEIVEIEESTNKIEETN